jgi:hypothetical protein
MDQDLEAFQLLAEIARLPIGQEDLRRIREFLRVLNAKVKAGDTEGAYAVIDDVNAKCLLSQALPGWEWGKVGANGPPGRSLRA